MYKILYILILLVIKKNSLQAQNTYGIERKKIDTKRAALSEHIDNVDTLLLSREFIRLDSTYYVGYMYEGMYKYIHAVDAIGFQQAIPALEKARQLLEKENAFIFKNLYSSEKYYDSELYGDYLEITKSLEECYDNLEMPDKVMTLLDKILSWNFKGGWLSSYTYALKAWTVHRKRFYTNKEYNFLKNTVEQNEQLALSWCYKGLQQVEINRSTNDSLYGFDYSKWNRWEIYHYIAIFHSYLKNYDSAEYYYQILREGNIMSQNNYASLQLEKGKFAKASYYYKKGKISPTENKRLQSKVFSLGARSLDEYSYYLPILSIYAGNPKEGIITAQEAIQRGYSMPGYGWYNLALARSYLYDGQLDSTAVALNKAARFKEIHIGTTLTQEQYIFTVQLLQLNLIDRQIAQIKFTDKRWWMHPSQIFEIAQLSSKRLLQIYSLVTKLALNPERQRIIYDLFCGESTIMYDEAWTAIKDFSPQYFVDWFTNRLKIDTRKDVRRYFKLWIALLQWEKGEKKLSGNSLEELLYTRLDTDHERLFLARLYEALCKYYDDEGNDKDYNYYINLLYQVYPSLLTYSDLKVPVQINISGIDDDVMQQIINDLRKGNINITNDPQAIKANIQFGRKAQWYQVDIQTSTSSGTSVVEQTFYFKKQEGVGAELLLRLFGKGGATAWESEPASTNLSSSNK